MLLSGLYQPFTQVILSRTSFIVLVSWWCYINIKCQPYCSFPCKCSNTCCVKQRPYAIAMPFLVNVIVYFPLYWYSLLRWLLPICTWYYSIFLMTSCKYILYFLISTNTYADFLWIWWLCSPFFLWVGTFQRKQLMGRLFELPSWVQPFLRSFTGLALFVKLIGVWIPKLGGEEQSLLSSICTSQVPVVLWTIVHVKKMLQFWGPFF